MTSLEIPINPKKARQRGIDPGLCLLTISFSENEKESYSLMSKVFSDFCGNDKSVFATSIAEFVPLSKIISHLKIGEFIIIPEHNAIKSLNKQTTEKLLTFWSAESLIIFFQSDEIANKIYSSIPKLEKKWWQYSNEGFEGPFLKQIKYCDPLVFYSDSHHSFEIFGTKEVITHCLNAWEKLPNPPPNPEA